MVRRRSTSRKRQRDAAEDDNQNQRERERESHRKANRVEDTFQFNVVAAGAFKFVFEWLEMKPPDPVWRDA